MPDDCAMSTRRFSAHYPLVTRLAVVPLASASCRCTWLVLRVPGQLTTSGTCAVVAVFEQLPVDIQRQVEDVVIHPHRPHGHAVRGRRGAVGEKGVADALRLLERAQDAFAAGQRLAVHAGGETPVGAGGVDLALQVVAEEAVHQPAVRCEHARQIVRRHFLARPATSG